MLRHSHEWDEAIQENFRNPGNLTINILKQNIKIDTTYAVLIGQHSLTGLHSTAPLNCWTETDKVSSLEDYWWLLDGSFASANDNRYDEHYIAMSYNAVAHPLRQSALYKADEGDYRFTCSFTNDATILTEIDNTTDLLPIPLDDIYLVFDNVRYTGPTDGIVTVWYLKSDGLVEKYIYEIPEAWTHTITIEQQLSAVPTAIKINGLSIRWTSWTDGMRPKLTTVAIGGPVEPEEGWNIVSAELTKEASYLCNAIPSFGLSLKIDNTHRSFDPTLRTGVAAELSPGMLLTAQWGQQVDTTEVEAKLPWESWVISSIEIPEDYTSVTIKCEPLAQYYKDEVITGYTHIEASGLQFMESAATFITKLLENFIIVHGDQFFNKYVKVPYGDQFSNVCTDGPNRSIGFLNVLLYVGMVARSAVSLDTISGLPKLVSILQKIESIDISSDCYLQLQTLETQTSIDSFVLRGVQSEKSEADTSLLANLVLTEDIVRRMQFNTLYESYEIISVDNWQNLEIPNRSAMDLDFDYVRSETLDGWSVLMLYRKNLEYRDSSNVGRQLTLFSEKGLKTVSNQFSNISTSNFNVAGEAQFVDNPCMGLIVNSKENQSSLLIQAIKLSKILSRVTHNKYIITFNYTGRPDLEPFDVISIIIPEIDEAEPQDVVILSCTTTYNGGYSGTIKGLVITSWV